MITYTSSNMRIWSRLGSCGAFGIAAMELPEMDDGSVILTADLCFYSGLDRFRSKYPDRLYNIGIAEQNMLGVAGGLAKEGFNVFATTYASFAASRCIDQVRVNMGYMKLGIKLVGLTSGLSVGILGATHVSMEDVAVMRSIPNITILSPADSTETIKATLAAAKMKTPVYLRLSGTMNNPAVYKEDYSFEIGKAVTMQEGSDITLIASGTMVHYSMEAAKELERKGISCKVVNMHTIKPLDIEAIHQACNTELIVTVEEHNIYGGLGSAVAEVLAGMPKHPALQILGLADHFKHAGEYEYLLEQYGLTGKQISDKVSVKYLEVKHNVE